VVQPVAEIAKIAAEAGAYFHTDAVQAAGKIMVRVREIGCDLLTVSGHKMHGPQGVGALYVRKGTELEARQYGGRHERSRRAGTENVAGTVGLGKAAEMARAGLERGEDKKIAELRDRLEKELSGIEASSVNGGSENPHTTQTRRCMGPPRVPNTTNICFDGIDGEALVIALDLKGLAVSTGAACSSGAIEPSHVLLAMGLTPDRARASIRFSLGKLNTTEEVEFAVGLVRETVERLRELSPVWGRTATSR
jgi:cysteine desulfurase